MKSTRDSVVINSSKFATYTLAGAAAAIGVSETADADITYNAIGTLLEDTVVDGGNGPGITLSFGPASSYGLDLFHVTPFSSNPGVGIALAGALFGGSLNNVSVAGFSNTAGTYLYASNVASGASIGGLSNWLPASGAGTMAFGSNPGTSQFQGAGEGFLAVRFNDGGGFVYGWVRVNMTGAPLNSFTVVDYGFADQNELLAAGEGTPIPEPGSLAGLALGAVGLANWRRRRQNG